MVRITVVLPIALVFGSAMLSSCGTGGTDAKTERTATTANRASDLKHSAYVSGFNAIATNNPGMAGGWLANAATAYAAYHIPNRKPSDTIGISMNPDFLSGVTESLKKARSAPGSTETVPLDTAADRLIPALEKVLAFERQLGPYYASRAYRDDKLAKGKAADAPLKAAYENAQTSMDTMEQALAAYEREASAARVAKLRSAGHEAEATLAEAMQRAELMISALTDDDDATAARESTALAQAIDRMRANQDKLQPIPGNAPGYKVILGELTDMQGQFSDYRNGDASAKAQTVNYYNMAVRSANSFRMPE